MSGHHQRRAAAGGDSPVTVSYIANSYEFDGSDRSTYTFTGVELGGTAGDHWGIMLFPKTAKGGPWPDLVTSITVGGASAGTVYEPGSVLNSGSVNSTGCSLCIMEGDGSTTGTIVASLDRESKSCGVATFLITGLQSTTPTDTGSQRPDGNGIDLDVEAGGAVIGGLMTNGSAVATPVNIDYDFGPLDMNGEDAYGASREFASAQTALNFDLGDASGSKRVESFFAIR